MSAAWRPWSLVLLASVAIAGCTSDNFVVEHPVLNQAPPLKPGVYSINSVDVRPVATREIEPDYPFELESVLTGNAVVVFTVRTDGKVEDTSVVQADDVLFGEAAIDAVRKWRFRPAQVKGAPVDCRMSLPFVFVSPYANYMGVESMPDPSDRAPLGGPHQVTTNPR